MSLSDAELRALTEEYKERYGDGERLDDLLPEAFAPSARRPSASGQRHYDVQMMGGAALHLGYVAEMKTGEGKTLVGTLPAYLNALSGKGVHLITVNDYLAERDSEMMGRVHKFLGLSVGCILANMTPAAAPRAVQLRHHVRHEQRVRLRLPARQHGVVPGRAGPARPQLRHRRRGRLDPRRRGPYAADHLRPRRPGHQVVRRLRQAGHAPDQGRGGQPAQGHRGDRRLRGRREEAHRRHPRARCRQGRGLAGHRQPLRVGEHPARRLPEQRHQGQGTLQERQGLRRHRRRSHDRRRAHRPYPRRPPLQRGHAPGDRGEGRGGHQGREPDARHDHPAELLPPVRQARPA